MLLACDQQLDLATASSGKVIAIPLIQYLSFMVYYVETKR